MLKSIRILLAIATYYDYEIWQMDVKTTCLNEKLLEDVYMTQPKGFVNPDNVGKVCKLQRSIYGVVTPRARPDPVGGSEPKPRGRSFNSFYSHFISFSFSKVSRPESPSRPEGQIRTGARFTPTFSFILSNIYLCYIILGFRLHRSIFKWEAHKLLHFTKCNLQ